MWKNYIKIAWRNLIREKTYSLINTAGLTVGIACCLVIGIYIIHELSYDRFFPKTDRIYRVVQLQDQAGALYRVATTPALLKEKLKTDYSGVEKATGFSRIFSNRLFQYQEKSFEEGGGFHVDANFFELFPFAFLKGSTRAFFGSSDAIILTEDMADKYFSNENPIGKIINIDKKQDFIVRAVVENPPSNSHLKFNFLLPIQNLRAHRSFDSWGANWMYTYILLEDKADASSFEHKISSVLSDNIGNPDWQPKLYLQALADIHLYSDFDFNTDFADTVNLQSIYLFGIIGLIILFISCINFINLSTAKSFQRAKEVGVRKVVGASRKQLIYQFIGESVLIAFISALFALAIAQICMPYFANVSGLPLSLDLLPVTHLVIFLLAILLAGGLLAGVYPALFLSAFNPVKTLKGLSVFKENYTGQIRLRKILIVSQFALSVFLIVGAIIIRQQMHYVLNRNLGFDQEHILYTPAKGALEDDGRYESFKRALLEQSSVIQATRSNSLPINHEGSYSGVEWEGMSEGHRDFLMSYLEVDDAFVLAFGLKILAGHNFSPRTPNDSSSYYLINETALKMMEMDDPLGKRLEEGKIIGVVNDFNFKSAFSGIEPMILRNEPGMFKKYISIRIAPGRISEALAFIEQTYKEFNPGYPFTYHFLDESIEALYDQQVRIGKLIDLFAVLAVFISCLGLFGLSAFMAVRRTKEVGIRKVLGATIPNIVKLLSKEFLKPVLLGFVITIPLSWYIMNRWLTEFAYRIEIDPKVFVITGISIIMIALVTVSWQSVRAALKNPVESLRNE